MTTFGHTLVFGGTGMLEEATKWLIDESTKTRVFGRSRTKLKQFTHLNTSYRQLDYTDTDSLIKEIYLAYKEDGPIHTILAWIHNTAPNALPVINQQLEQLQDDPWTLYLVKGSSSDIENIKSSQQNYAEHFKLKIIQLGYKNNGHTCRWLTHEEISAGTIEAMQTKKDLTIVGTLDS